MIDAEYIAFRLERTALRRLAGLRNHAIGRWLLTRLGRIRAGITLVSRKAAV